jgi:iron(II)-dependent oxidoreductase
MRLSITQKQALYFILSLSTAMLLAGVAWHSKYLAAGGAAGGIFAIVRLVARKRRLARIAATPVEMLPADVEDTDEIELPAAPPARRGGGGVGDLVEEMLDQRRYALLLRPQLVTNLDADQLARTLTALSEKMSLTPPGQISLLSPAAALECGPRTERGNARSRPNVCEVDGYCLDRFPITNAEYYQFLSAGGYEQMSLWEPEIQAMVIELVDQSGRLGPRFWKNGRYARGLDNHPVVGISWYEAAAYARWVGKRLPSDAEWVKAASWPVPMGDGSAAQRKFPWGDAMDHGRANVWGTGLGTTVPVNELTSGASVGGVYHMVGNVWEWIAGDYGDAQEDFLRPSDSPSGHSLKSIRGGAFDTYFDVQSSCQFQSGERPLLRKHNIGFRCALSLCDVATQQRLHELPAEELNAQPELVEASQ